MAQRPVWDAIFLDRDGTLNVKAPEGEYVTSPDELRLLPGVVEALALLRRMARRLIVVTNQRGIALGRMSPDDLERVHERLERLLGAGGALDAIYHCPHHLASCDCRKPGIGMLTSAQRDFGLADLRRTVLIGDSITDLRTAAAAGAQSILVTTGAVEASRPLPPLESPPMYVAASLLDAARWLAQARETGPAVSPV
jgi:D-glycero-D-manno-heptose 1,7-bisphosphate phosphatase